AIYGWIQNYTALMKKYVDTLKPNLSAVWQMDETFVTFKGIRPDLKMKLNNGYYCWVAIDTGTRFILDMYLGIDKSLDEGIAFFERIKQAIKDEPDVVATDGNVTYQTCLKRYYPSATHVKLRQISLEPNTSFIERYNGTIKNRTKTMRCFDEFYPCQTTLTAFQIYYNFLRPHMALGGKTPAQESGINVEFPERWASLIRNALFFSG
ncbi:MAG: DDE-type integrase/transposase/recombinase, partial [Nanoarchaeota archaeon]